jgi:small subunit ribosomal protein S18
VPGNAEKQGWIAKRLIQEETQKLEEFFRNLQNLPQGAQHQIKMNTPQVTMEKKPHQMTLVAPRNKPPPDVIQANNMTVDYRNIQLLSQFVTESGKIIPRKLSGLSKLNQIKITQAIKRARHFGLIPYTAKHRDFSREMKYSLRDEGAQFDDIFDAQKL